MNSFRLFNFEYMKYFWATIVFIMLIGLPIGSYLYLQAGYDYRMNTLKELEPQNDFVSEMSSPSEFLKSTLTAKLFNKLTVAHYVNSNTTRLQMEQMNKLWDQYGVRDNFRIIRLVDTVANPIELLDNVPDSLIVNMDYKLDGTKDAKSIYLIGTEGKVRGKYTFEEERFKKLVEHVPVLIPIPEHQKIKLKRDL